MMGFVAVVLVSLVVQQLGVRFAPFTFTPVYRKTFTWIGHHVDYTFAEWCKNLGFSDVVVRYDTDEAGSASNLAAVGVTYWRFSGSYFYVNTPQTVEAYKAKLLEELAISPTGKIFVDDTFSLDAWCGRQGLINFLEAVKQLGDDSDNVILCFSLMSEYDLNLIKDLGSHLSGLNFEVYHPPTMTIDNETVSVLGSTQAKSVGHVLWAWGWQGNGVSWEGMTEALVRKIYAEAEYYGFSRITVWNGHETDQYEVGMQQASLYNYPQWWDIVKTANAEYLSS
ncbi:hypothetical protein MUP42_02275 [Candidatus Bathyarchaeota archaeon]|nr:hypothetical protein [Candidatus Bathyarchaeota archaeon]